MTKDSSLGYRMGVLGEATGFADITVRGTQAGYEAELGGGIARDYAVVLRPQPQAKQVVRTAHIREIVSYPAEVLVELESQRREIARLRAEVARLRERVEPKQEVPPRKLSHKAAKAAVLRMFQERHWLSYSDAVVELDLDVDMVMRIFEDLEEEGCIREKPSASRH